MRICLLGDSALVPLQLLIEFLLKNGNDVYVIGNGQFQDGVKYHPLPEGTLARLLSRRFVRQMVERIEPSIVHAFYLTSYGYLASGIRNRPVLATSMGTDIFGAPELSFFLRPLRNHLAKYAIRRADRIHSVAEHMTERLVELGANPKRIETFPRGVSMERFPVTARENHRTDIPDIICTRKLEPVYDHLTILKAARLLKTGNVPFRIRFLGNGYLRDELVSRSDSLGISNSVTFTPQIPHKEIPGVLAKADIYLSASLSDGTSSSLLEAMASGCVPVVSRIPGNLPWMIRSGENLMFEPGNPQSLAEALAFALKNRSSWPEWRRNGRTLVMEHGSQAASFARIMKIYKELTGQEATAKEAYRSG